MKCLALLKTLLMVTCVPFMGLSQSEIENYEYFQITNAWFMSSADTVDITDNFSHDYFFAFFVEDDFGEIFFTIRSHENNETVCLGEVYFDSKEEGDDYLATVYNTNVFCSQDQEEPVASLVLENIPNSKEETGYDFYYIWLILNSEEAIVFQCFDAKNLTNEEG